MTRVVPRYVKNMLSAEIFFVGISGRSCCFDEYLYYDEIGNDAAALLFQDFQASLEL